MKKRLQQDATSISPHYITDSIKGVYFRKLRGPVMLLIVLCFMWFIFPISSLFYPETPSNLSAINNWDEIDDGYISTTIDSLYFTGYTSSILGQTNGYYYYTMLEDECILVLLSPHTCEEGISEIQNLQFRGKVCTPGLSYDQLLTNLADDLEWTHAGLLSQMAAVYLSEPAYTGVTSLLFIGLYIGTGTYCILYILMCILFILLPRLSPTCIQLGKFGNAGELLAQAEEELSTLPQLATEDMFITETFFIEISTYGVAIVPIQEIIWIYKHSTLHKFLWYHFVISYTLHITGNKHFYIQCPKNIKSDIDGIMDYLAEANHDILVGFNETNRLKVQEIQKRGMHLERIVHFLQKRI